MKYSSGSGPYRPMWPSTLWWSVQIGFVQFRPPRASPAFFLPRRRPTTEIPAKYVASFTEEKVNNNNHSQRPYIRCRNVAPPSSCMCQHAPQAPSWPVADESNTAFPSSHTCWPHFLSHASDRCYSDRSCRDFSISTRWLVTRKVLTWCSEWSATSAIMWRIWYIIIIQRHWEAINEETDWFNNSVVF